MQAVSDMVSNIQLICAVTQSLTFPLLFSTNRLQHYQSTRDGYCKLNSRQKVSLFSSLHVLLDTNMFGLTLTKCFAFHLS